MRDRALLREDKNGAARAEARAAALPRCTGRVPRTRRASCPASRCRRPGQTRRRRVLWVCCRAAGAATAAGQTTLRLWGASVWAAAGADAPSVCSHGWWRREPRRTRAYARGRHQSADRTLGKLLPILCHLVERPAFVGSRPAAATAEGLWTEPRSTGGPSQP